MTICNMSIEAGARSALIAPDATTLAFLEGRPHAPKGADWTAAVERWTGLTSDRDARFDAEITIDVTSLAPLVTWGTRPDMVEPVTGKVPDPKAATSEGDARAMERALTYMGLTPGTAIDSVPVDRVFIGSCTNARLEDLRAAATRGRAATRSTAACARWSSPVRRRSRPTPSAKDSIAFLPTPVSSGANPAARCASA